MPKTKHDELSYDCHPIPGTPLLWKYILLLLLTVYAGSMPPSLLVTVSGTVIHGKLAMSAHPVPSKVLDNQPRIFAQTFMLAPDSDTSAPSDPSKPNVKYYILTDDLRFVG